MEGDPPSEGLRLRNRLVTRTEDKQDKAEKTMPKSSLESVPMVTVTGKRTTNDDNNSSDFEDHGAARTTPKPLSQNGSSPHKIEIKEVNDDDKFDDSDEIEVSDTQRLLANKDEENDSGVEDVVFDEKVRNSFFFKLDAFISV